MRSANLAKAVYLLCMFPFSLFAFFDARPEQSKCMGVGTSSGASPNDTLRTLTCFMRTLRQERRRTSSSFLTQFPIRPRKRSWRAYRNGQQPPPEQSQLQTSVWVSMEPWRLHCLQSQFETHFTCWVGLSPMAKCAFVRTRAPIIDESGSEVSSTVAIMLVGVTFVAAVSDTGLS